MKTPGEYALLKANGASWADIVAEIRTEFLMVLCPCAVDLAERCSGSLCCVMDDGK